MGDYKDAISGENQAHDYYNKCSHYLLELIAGFVARSSISGSEIQIIFEKKRGHDYQRLQRYLETICKSPIDARAAKLQHLAPFKLQAKEKDEEQLLSLPDCVAFALNKAFSSESNRLDLTEQRYLRELKSKFCACKETTKIANFGLKFIKGPIRMGLTGNDLKYAMKFYEETSEPK